MKSLNPTHPMTQFTTEHLSSFLLLALWLKCDSCLFISDEEIARFKKEVREPGLAISGVAGGVEVRMVHTLAEAERLVKEDERFNPNSPHAKAMRRHEDAKKNARSMIDKLKAGHGSPGMRSLMKQAAEVIDALTWAPK